MGLFDFVKSAGAKIFGSKPDPAEQAAALHKSIGDLGLEIEGLGITVDEGVATVRGTAPDQATREKAVLVVGNTEGIGQVDDQIEVKEPEPEATYYTVVSGDTLGKIAKAHYGNAMKYPAVFEANRPMLEDPDKIYPGQVLRIPPQAD